MTQILLKPYGTLIELIYSSIYPAQEAPKQALGDRPSPAHEAANHALENKPCNTAPDNQLPVGDTEG